jgi:hypothetical protein
MTSEFDEQLAWRETYFVMFSTKRRPTLTQVEGAIADASERLHLENMMANDDGRFESGLVQAPEDNAAIEISFESGGSVIEQSAEAAKRFKKQLTAKQLSQLLKADARLDIMHFERMPDVASEFDDEPDEDLLDEVLDPASLITVVGALAKLTGGIAIDPASGEVMV